MNDKMKLYSQDIMICATVYVKARSVAQAQQVIAGLKDSSPSILDHEGDVEVTGTSFDNPALPPVSLSPAMTICQPVANTEPELFSDDDVPDGGAAVLRWETPTHGKSGREFVADTPRDLKKWLGRFMIRKGPRKLYVLFFNGQAVTTKKLETVDQAKLHAQTLVDHEAMEAGAES